LKLEEIMKITTAKLSAAALLAMILSPALALAQPVHAAAHRDHSSRPHVHEVSLHH
jgi:hypothetical protein